MNWMPCDLSFSHCVMVQRGFPYFIYLSIYIYVHTHMYYIYVYVHTHRDIYSLSFVECKLTLLDDSKIWQYVITFREVILYLLNSECMSLWLFLVIIITKSTYRRYHWYWCRKINMMIIFINYWKYKDKTRYEHIWKIYLEFFLLHTYH